MHWPNLYDRKAESRTVSYPTHRRHIGLFHVDNIFLYITPTYGLNWRCKNAAMHFTDYDKLYRTAEHFRNVIGDESGNIMTAKHSSNTTTQHSIFQHPPVEGI